MARRASGEEAVDCGIQRGDQNVLLDPVVRGVEWPVSAVVAGTEEGAEGEEGNIWMQFTKRSERRDRSVVNGMVSEELGVRVVDWGRLLDG